MKRAMIAALIASTLLAGQAIAAGKTSEQSGEAEPRSMDAPYIAAPIVRNGVLSNYLFVSVRVDIAPGVDLWRTRERAHYLRDALVRAAHRTPLADAENPNAIDTALAVQVFRAAAIEALGERAVRGVSITGAQSSRGGHT